MPRSTRRKGRREAEPEEPDEGDEGDDFAWQSPKKKSSKGKKSTGRSERPERSPSSSTKKSSTKTSTKGSTRGKSGRTSSEGSGKAKSTSSKSASTKKKSGGASSSTRKSGSARSKRASGEEDLGNSGRRRRAAPAKKKGVDPIIPISIVTVTILLCVGMLFVFNREPPKQVNEENDWATAKALEDEGMNIYREFLAARKSDQPDVIKHKREEAIKKLTQAVEAMNAVLDPKRDAEGMLPADFEGYETDLSRISRYLIDLEKM